MSKVTQKQQVLEYMRTRGSITTFIAFDEFDICRLSERIRELERDGHLIHHTPITHNGKSYVAYSLVEGERKAA
jgi:hypothetical protein